ncbi:65-kDa microtubule-associated protein 4 isoform X2 [Lolium perenne]|uniref:65-kDa microtubule-associated protein 4 isoform X2 n=1 Tax=Lolium perenne TaxID=4522 RepID=UPI0021F66689|nr:65-kDa microtubule-associated protein 3-like isoform X2 [Lolium perenne]
MRNPNSPPASPPPASPRRRTPPPPPRRTPPPPPRRDGPLDSSDAERRYPRRSTRAALTPKQLGRALALAPPPPQSQPSQSSSAARRYPLRSTRPTLLRGRNLTAPTSPPPSIARTSPRPSAAPTSPPPLPAPTPPPPPSKSPLDAAHEQWSYATISEENDKVIKINMEELHTVLDTLGVSVAERHKVTNNVLKKCLVAYKGALEYEKNRCSSMAEAISDLEAQHRELCSVLGEKDALLEERMSASLSQIHQSLTASLRRLNVFKKQRLENLQRMQAKVMDLWDHMGVTLDQQKEYRYIMRNSVASLAEVTQKDALSAALLTKIQSELAILEGQLIEKVAKRFAVLAANLRQTHLSDDEDYKINFTMIDVRAGSMDMFGAADKLEELVVKSAKDILLRESIVSRAEIVLRHVKEGSSLHTRETVENLINRVKAWEAKNERKFFYDKERLIATLHKLKEGNDHHFSDATNVSPGEKQSSAPLETAESPTWSDSLPEFSDNRESDQESDPDFSASESEEE